MAGRGDVLDYTAIQAACSTVDQASGSLLTHYPMIDVRLDHEFLPDLFPQVEVHGSPLRLI